MKFQRSVRLGAGLACVALLLSACGGGADDNPEAEASETLKVGVLTDLSSIFSIYGIPNARAVELGFEYATDGTMEVDGKKIEIIVRDDQNNPEVGVAAARELIEQEGVDLIAGTMSSSVTKAVMELVDGKDVIYMPVASAEEVTGEWFTENTFRLSRNIQIDANAMVEYVKGVEPDTDWALLAPNYALGHSGANALHDSVEKVDGMGFVEGSDIFAPPETTDFTPYLGQIKNSGADYFANFWVADQSSLYQQMGDMGLSNEVETIGLLANDPLIPDVYPVGALGTTPYRYDLIDNDVNDWFVEHYMEEYGEAPNVIAGPAFSSAVAYVRALEEAGDSAADAMIPTLESVSFESVWGEETSFRKCDHAGLIPYYVTRVADLEDPDGHWLELEMELTAEEAAVPCEVPGRN